MIFICRNKVWEHLTELWIYYTLRAEQNDINFAEDISIAYSWMQFILRFEISLRFVAEGKINNKSPLVQIMAWHKTGAKPLPEPIMTQFIATYMWQSASRI